MFWFILLGFMLLVVLGSLLLRRATKAALARDETNEDALVGRTIATGVLVAATVAFVILSLYAQLRDEPGRDPGLVSQCRGELVRPSGGGARPPDFQGRVGHPYGSHRGGGSCRKK